MIEELEVPTFTYGTYRALDGTEVTFTDDFMRQLEKNTNFVIGTKALTPPVGYDTINADGTYAHRGTDAHAHVKAVKYRNGVLSLALTKPSEQFRSDVKEGRRLRVSGEFNPNFSYTDAGGNVVNVGPTIVGLAALGRHRPALKNPSLVPLSDLPFGEAVSAADAWQTREELRKAGFVAQTLADGKYAFSEIDVDPQVFGEQEQTMTDEQIQAAIAAGIKTATAPLLTKIEEQGQQITKFSETAKRESAAHSFCEKFIADRKQKGAPVPLLFTEQLETMLADPSYTDAQIAAIKLLAERAPGAMVGAGRAGERTNANGDTELVPEEPKPLSDLRPRHFAEMDNPESQAKIDAGLLAFAEFKPDAFKGIENNPAAQMQKLSKYITDRDTAPTN